MLDQKIAAKIKKTLGKSKNILIPLHLSPDGDSLGSCLAMTRFLEKKGKKASLVSCSEIASSFKTLIGVEKIQITDLSQLDFSQFDLFLALDIAQLSMISRNLANLVLPPKLKIVNIDHHLTNTNFGGINLVDQTNSSTAEMLYELFSDWQEPIDSIMAQLLFLAIFSDTGCFQYPCCSIKTMKIATQLREKGANLNKTVLEQFRSYSFKNLKYWALVLQNTQLDKSGLFTWAKTTLKQREALGIGPGDMQAAASLFCPVTEGTEFGIILDEQKGFVKASLRSRQGFDVSSLAVLLGGGGHQLSAGFVLRTSLEEAEKIVLKIARDAIN